MPRKPNYDFEKRRKEQERRNKKEAKRAERQQRRDDRRDEEVNPGAPDSQPTGPEGANEQPAPE
jgi:hypothetical protein